MRIRHLLPALGFVPQNPDESAFGGVTMTAWQLASRQIREGNVGIIGLSRNGRPFRLTHKGVILKGVLPWNRAHIGKYDFHYLAPVLLQVLLEKPEILHCHSETALLYMPARFHILHLHNVPVQFESHFFEKAYAHANAIICCSDYVRCKLLAMLPKLSDITSVIHNGGQRHLPTGENIRVLLGIPREALVILYVGAVTPEKGLHVLIEAFTKLLNDIPECHLLIAGSSRLWFNARASASISTYEIDLQKLSLDMPVHFLGSVAQNSLGDVYHCADIFAAPSVWDEPFGITIVEAMAAGLPVVASKVGGIPEIVNEDVGRLVPPNDAEAVAKALLELVRDNTLRSQLSGKSLERSKLFTWDRAYESVAQIYSKISDGQRLHR